MSFISREDKTSFFSSTFTVTVNCTSFEKKKVSERAELSSIKVFSFPLFPFLGACLGEMDPSANVASRPRRGQFLSIFNFFSRFFVLHPCQAGADSGWYVTVGISQIQ
jgi:hypothetical protein